MPGAPLVVFNSLGRKVEEFVPAVEGEVRMYSCGPTVYSYIHIGNLRAYVFADTLKRALTWKGLDVEHVINITDVGHLVADADQGDDKIEEAAKREQRTVWEITQHYTDSFVADLERMNIRPPAAWTKATDYVPQMIEFAAELERTGFTYRLADGLYMDTSKVPHYGELAVVDLSQLEEGARIGEVEGRRNPTDFALWRTYSDPERRMMWWDSPWGPGAPGWHLECSVMSIEKLGRHFDLHTGGIDHVNIHHPNEIAQSEAWIGDGEPWVRYWMHNEFLLLGGSKMAKSSGKVALLSDLMAEGIHPLGYRWFLLSAHYRTQLDFVDEAIMAAQKGLFGLGERLASFGAGLAADAMTYEIARTHAHSDAARALVEQVDAAISDDLATPRVIAAINAFARGELSPGGAQLANDICGSLLGVDPIAVINERAASTEVRRDEVEAVVEEKLAARNAARAAKDFVTSDQIRDELAAMGVIINDGPTGTTWTVA